MQVIEEVVGESLDQVPAINLKAEEHGALRYQHCINRTSRDTHCPEADAPVQSANQFPLLLLRPGEGRVEDVAALVL
jgi:hypothetical protein